MKDRKRSLSLILALVILLGMLPVSTFAEEAVEAIPAADETTVLEASAPEPEVAENAALVEEPMQTDAEQVIEAEAPAPEESPEEGAEAEPAEETPDAAGGTGENTPAEAAEESSPGVSDEEPEGGSAGNPAENDGEEPGEAPEDETAAPEDETAAPEDETAAPEDEAAEDTEAAEDASESEENGEAAGEAEEEDAEEIAVASGSGTTGGIRWTVSTASWPNSTTLQGEGDIPEDFYGDVLSHYVDSHGTSLTIYNEITGIGNRAFLNADLRGTPNFPYGSSMKRIGEQAFEGCANLTGFNIPDTVTEIADYAFYGCSGLKTITIPAGGSLKRVGNAAFYNCAVSTLTMPTTVTEIGTHAFSGCVSLKTLFFKGNLPTLADDAFADLSGCTVYYPPTASGYTADSMKQYGGSGITWKPDSAEVLATGSYEALSLTLYADGRLVVSGSGVIPGRLYSEAGLSDYLYQITSVELSEGITEIASSGLALPNLRQLSLPNTLKTIGDYAFSDSSLTEVTIPASVTEIGANPFRNCGRLTDIRVDKGSANFKDTNGVLFSKDGKILLCFPTGRTGSYAIPAGTAAIGIDAFAGGKLEAVSVPAGMTSLGDSAFRSLASLKLVELPEGLVSIGADAFAACIALETIRIPDGVRSIGRSAFRGCGCLQNISLPEGMTEIAMECFYNCSGLKTVALPSTLNYILYDAFGYCGALEEIILPSGLKNIGDLAFYYCGTLTLRFTGPMPAIHSRAFNSDQITAWYPGSDESYSSDRLKKYGAHTIEWKPYAGVPEEGTELKLDHEYVILKRNDTVQLSPVGLDAKYLELISWDVSYIEGKDFLSVSSTGLVTAASTGSGSAWVTASLPTATGGISARCRVDVENVKYDLDVYKDIREHGVRLIEKKATVSLFSTEHTRLSFVPVLEQNLSVESNLTPGLTNPTDAELRGDTAIRSARFRDPAVATYFKLQVVDDRTLEIIPTVEAMELGAANAKELKASYKKVGVSVTTAYTSGGELDAGTLDLSITKTQPKITVKAVKLNSFAHGYGDSRKLEFSGGEVTKIELAPGATVPAGFSLDPGTQTVSYVGSSGGKTSGKLSLLVTVEGWAIRKTVTVSLSASRTAPTISYKPATLSLLPTGTAFDRTEITIKPAEFADITPAVTRVTEGSGKNMQTWYSPEFSSILFCSPSSEAVVVGIGTSTTLDTSVAHTFKVYLSVAGVEKPFTVKVAAKKSPALAMKSSGSIEAGLPGSYVDLTLTASGFHGVTKQEITITEKKVGTTAEIPADDQFVIERLNDEYDTSGKIPIRIKAKNYKDLLSNHYNSKYTIKARMNLNIIDNDTFTGYKSQTLSVRWTNPDKIKAAISLSLKGSLDVVRPDKSVLVKATAKNMPAFLPSYLDFYLNFYRIEGKTTTKLTSSEWSRIFATKTVDEGLEISLQNGAILNHKTEKYAVALEMTDHVGKTVSSGKKNLAITMGSAKVTLDTKSVTLLKDDRYSTADFGITVPEGVSLSTVALDAKSAKIFKLENLGNGRYSIGYRDGKIGISKATTVKLQVTLLGNMTGKPNTALSLKVNLG